MEKYVMVKLNSNTSTLTTKKIREATEIDISLGYLKGCPGAGEPFKHIFGEREGEERLFTEMDVGEADERYFACPICGLRGFWFITK